MFGPKRPGAARRWLCTLLWLLSLLPTLGVSQQFISLENPSRLKRFRFSTGDELQIRISGESTHFRYRILSFGNDSLMLSNRFGDRLEISTALVESIRMQAEEGFPFWANIIGTGMTTFGVVYLGLRAINSNQIEGPVYSEQALWLGGGLIASGLALKLSSRRTYRVGPDERWQLRILDLGTGLPARRR